MVMIMSDWRTINQRILKSRDEINSAIKAMCVIESTAHEAWVDCDNEAVDTAVYIDTDAGTCETFKLEAKVVTEIVIT
jgi:hypothetical protein